MLGVSGDQHRFLPVPAQSFSCGADARLGQFDRQHPEPTLRESRRVPSGATAKIEDEALRLRYTKCKSCSDLEREDRGE